jgi:hypothetical protein
MAVLTNTRHRFSPTGSLWRSRWAAVGAAVVVTLAAGGLVAVNAAPSAPSSFVSVDPARVLDTRTNVGLPGPFVSGVAQKLKVTGTVRIQPPNNAPAINQQVVPAGATAVTLNVTVVRPASRGYLSIRPGDASGTPATSNINFGPGGPNIANAVTVALPTTGPTVGFIDIYVNGSAGDVLIDVAGYFQPGAGGTSSGLVSVETGLLFGQETVLASSGPLSLVLTCDQVGGARRVRILGATTDSDAVLMASAFSNFDGSPYLQPGTGEDSRVMFEVSGPLLGPTLVTNSPGGGSISNWVGGNYLGIDGDLLLLGLGYPSNNLFSDDCYVKADVLVR